MAPRKTKRRPPSPEDIRFPGYAIFEAKSFTDEELDELRRLATIEQGQPRQLKTRVKRYYMSIKGIVRRMNARFPGRNFTDLEVMAAWEPAGLKPRRWGWPPEAVEYLHKKWGVESPRVIARILTIRFPKRFTVDSIGEMARAEGLLMAEAQGDLSITEAARQLGIARCSIMRRIERGEIASHVGAKNRFITQEDFEKLKAIYPRLDGEWIQLSQAITRLDRSQTFVKARIADGTLKSRKVGAYTMIQATDVEKLRLDLERERLKKSLHSKTR